MATVRLIVRPCVQHEKIGRVSYVYWQHYTVHAGATIDAHPLSQKVNILSYIQRRGIRVYGIKLANRSFIWENSEGAV